MGTPTSGHTFSRAGSSRSGPADRRRRSQRVFASMLAVAMASAGLYANSVANRQPGASAVNGVLDAFDDSAQTLMNESVTIDVNTNDTGEPDVSSYAVVEFPANGTVGAFDPTTGEIAYQPDPGWIGLDEFIYSVDEIPGGLFDESGLTSATSPSGPLSVGVLDPDWYTSETPGGKRTAAQVIGQADPSWAVDPFGQGGWLCSQTCPTGAGTVYFHRLFQIVDQATADGLALALDVYSDDVLEEVYVNAVAASIQSSGVTNCAGCATSIQLRSSGSPYEFVVGNNWVTFQVRGEDSAPMGLMVTPGTGDGDSDGVADAEDRCVTTPSGSLVTANGCRRELATVMVDTRDPARLPGGICGQPVNGSFEVKSLGGRNWSSVDDDDVPGWTSTTNWLEFWTDGFLGVSAIDGQQLAELNAKDYTTIYQDVPTTPGETLQWRFNHRGRTGIDVMRFLAGPPTSTGEPVLVSQTEAATGKTWTVYSGSYVVPAGQTTTRIAFANVSSGNGRPSYGNLIDHLTFVNRCAAPPTTTTTTTTTVPPTTSTTTTTVPPATSTTTTTVPPATSTTTTTVPVTTSTTTTVPLTASSTTTTAADGDVTSDAPDTDGDGTEDTDDPTPLFDAHIQFENVERTTGPTTDTLRYVLKLGNNGPHDAAATAIAITPPAGALIEGWTFDSWATSLAADSGSGVLFGGALAAEPVCWLDAFVLRCEMGTVAAGWAMDLEVAMTVYEEPSQLEALASVVAYGYDTDLDNNSDVLTVSANSRSIPIVPEALAFTGLHLDLIWMLSIASALIGLGGFFILAGSRRRNDEPI